MSFAKAIVERPEIASEVLRLYRETNHSMKQIAEHMRFGIANVHEIVKRGTTPEERSRLKRIRLRDSKLGTLNPMSGKKPANFIGECADGYGYLTIVVDGERFPVHRVVMARMIGIHPSQLPSSLEVHHIDEDKTNNQPDNLVLSTKTAHASLHALTNWTSALRE
jgi:hypothetical protein